MIFAYKLVIEITIASPVSIQPRVDAMNEIELANALAQDNADDELLSQLRWYQKKYNRLEKVNNLYQRLAGAMDLPTIIETYSIWLAEHVKHDLIGYHNQTLGRMHLFCSSHGPERRSIITVAEKILRRPRAGAEMFQVDEMLRAYQWQFETESSCALLLLLKNDSQVSKDDMRLISESLSILLQPLKRSFDYEEIFSQAREDLLTGLPNRLVFEERIDCFIEQARRYGQPLTLAALDLDHFKEVNDTLGHPMGDKALQEVSRALEAEIRATDLLVRMGGDEFLLILPNTDMDDACHLSERLCQAIAKLNIPAGENQLGVSIGLAAWQPDMDKQTWLERADDILYQAKKNGRARVAVH